LKKLLKRLYYWGQIKYSDILFSFYTEMARMNGEDLSGKGPITPYNKQRFISLCRKLLYQSHLKRLRRGDNDPGNQNTVPDL